MFSERNPLVQLLYRKPSTISQPCIWVFFWTQWHWTSQSISICQPWYSFTTPSEECDRTNQPVYVVKNLVFLLNRYPTGLWVRKRPVTRRLTVSVWQRSLRNWLLNVLYKPEYEATPIPLMKKSEGGGGILFTILNTPSSSGGCKQKEVHIYS
jgi:hypothetical protein